MSFWSRRACCLAVAIFVSSAPVFAGKVELTTYYPAPHGEYKELKATENAYFATDTSKDGKVGIGTVTPSVALTVAKSGGSILATTANAVEGWVEFWTDATVNLGPAIIASRNTKSLRFGFANDPQTASGWKEVMRLSVDTPNTGDATLSVNGVKGAGALVFTTKANLCLYNAGCVAGWASSHVTLMSCVSACNRYCGGGCGGVGGGCAGVYAGLGYHGGTLVEITDTPDVTGCLCS